MENYLPCYEKSYCERTEKNVVCEINLAEYLPNASKIVKVSATAECGECEILKDAVNIHGQIKYNVVYLSDFKNRLKCTLGECDFSHTFPAKGIEDALSDSGFCDCSAVVIEEKGQLVSQRKFSVSCKVQLCVQAVTVKKTEIFDTEEKDGIYKLCKPAKYMSRIKLPETRIVFEENAGLDEGMPEIREIVFAECNVSSLSALCSGGKVTYNGKALLNCLYLGGGDEGEEYVSFSKELDFSKSMDVPGIDNGSFVIAKIKSSFANADPAQNNYGELSVCSVSCEINISSAAFCDSETEVICDAFSTSHDCNCETKNITSDFFVCGTEETAEVTENVRANLGSITDIILKNICVSVISAELSGKSPIYNMKAILKLMGTNEQGGLECVNTSFSFKVVSEKELEPIPEKYRFECEAFTRECSAKIENGEILCSLLLEIHSCIYASGITSAVTAMAIDKDTELYRNKSEHILYYPCAEDTVWSCAKNYRVSPKSLCAVNGMNVSDTNFGGRNVIVIPSPGL